MPGENENQTQQAAVEAKVEANPKPESGPSDALKTAWTEFANARDEIVPSADEETINEPESKSTPAAETPTDKSDAQDNDAIYREAREFGLSEPEAREVAKNPSLLSVIKRYVQTTKTEPTAQPTAQRDAAPEFEPFKLELGDEFDPKLKDQLGRMNQWYADQVKAIRNQVGSHENFRQQSIQTQQRVEFDQIAATLPNEYGDLIGKRFGDPELSPEQAAAREEMMTELLRAISSYHDAQGKYRGPELPKLLKRVAAGLHSDKIMEIAQRKVRSEVEARQSQSLSRPNSRPEATLSGNGTPNEKQRLAKMTELLAQR